MWHTAQLKYFACFPWNTLKDAADRTWHGKYMLSLPKMCCIISFFQHEEPKRKTKKGKERKVKSCMLSSSIQGEKSSYLDSILKLSHLTYKALCVGGRQEAKC